MFLQHDHKIKYYYIQVNRLVGLCEVYLTLLMQCYTVWQDSLSRLVSLPVICQNKRGEIGLMKISIAIYDI